MPWADMQLALRAVEKSVGYKAQHAGKLNNEASKIDCDYCRFGLASHMVLETLDVAAVVPSFRMSVEENALEAT